MSWRLIGAALLCLAAWLFALWGVLSLINQTLNYLNL